MPRYQVMYFDTDEIEHEVIVRADDEACALRVVLDEHDDIACGSPFAVFEVAGRKTKGKTPAQCEAPSKKAPKRAKKAPKKAAEPVAAGPLPITNDVALEEDAKAQLDRILNGTGCDRVVH